MSQLQPRPPRRLSGITLRVCLTTVVLYNVLGAALALKPSHGQGNNTHVFTIRSVEEAKKMVEMHATSTGEVMYTTVSFTHKGRYAEHMGDFAAHLWQSLSEVGRLENAIILSYDLHTCQRIMQRGIPCFLDRWSRQPSKLPGQYKDQVPHYYTKFSWAMKITEWGLTAVFFELDMVFLRDPLPHLSRAAYDLEGLSDWRTVEIPDPKKRFLETCTLYHMVKKENGYQSLDWEKGDPKNPRHTKHVNPCMSTGFWILHPASASKRFIADFIEIALKERLKEIEQPVWNEVVMAYLIGTESYKPPLRLGLLDESKFSNIGVYKSRRDQKLPSNPVMLHCGFISHDQKQPALSEIGFWKAEMWNPATAESFLHKLSQKLHLGVPHKE